MIGFLRGTVVDTRVGEITVDVHGVGYRVFVTETARMGCAGEVGLHIYTLVREQEISLYGFPAHEEYEMFLLLLGVSGIGPKAAMNILNMADVATIHTAIAREDINVLTAVSGIGAKTAKKVVAELAGKVSAQSARAGRDATAHVDAIGALQSMGYSVAEARAALADVDKSVTDVGECVRLALKRMGRK